MNLSELIDTHRGGRSYAELERDCGGSPSKGRLQQMVRQPIKNFPDPPTVRALARGLKVGQAAVVLAAAESLGLDVRSSRPRVVELLPGDAELLTERQAAAVAHLISTIVEVFPGEEVPTHEAGPEPTVGSVLDIRARLVEELGKRFAGDWSAALEFALWDKSDRYRHVISDLLLKSAQQKEDRGEWEPTEAVLERLLEAARHGQPSLSGTRHAQDQAGEAPDPEGPEHGA